MSINLITSDWLPVVRSSGATSLIAPHHITDQFKTDPILGLDFPRPDWNAAVTEWLIGILSVAAAPTSTEHWAAHWREPPSPERLQEAFVPIAFAFNLGGDGARCYQDLDPLVDAEETAITQLLIEFPGENTVKRNTDLFIKRRTLSLSPSEAAAALMTLQTYAPGGGAGHRTSMRGGGPFTTLIAPRRSIAGLASPVTPLWDLVWANVLTRAAAHQDWSQVFPWLAPTPTSEKGQVFTEEMAHPLHAFFGMPRRLRLRFDGAGHVTGYGTKPWGINYTGWSHPLSPYYKSPQGAWLPLHARSGPPSWRDWPSLWALSPDEKAKRAGTVESFVATRRRHLPEESTHQTVLAAFGYDMDNMKALRWVSFVAPWLPGLDADNGAEHARMMSALIKGGEEGASALRLAVRVAHYGVRDREGRYSVPDTVKRDGGIDPTPEFWAVTEAAFREAVQGFADRAGDEDHATRLTFLAALKREARDLFTEYTDEESLAEGDPERTLQALALLHAAFTPWGKVATALGVGIAKPKDKKVRA